MDDSLIRAMKGVVDDLYGHVHRVADLAIAIGKEMSLDPANVKRLSLVGILHDVGKIHIDPAVLAKPGPLDDMERDHMRRHPEIGYAMIAQKFDRRVAEAILYHHERWDGFGYPFGLAGEKIPLLSRIVLVADAFDAITSNRAYQAALPVDYAINEIVVNSGTQFDPAVAEAFLALATRGDLPAKTAPTTKDVLAPT
ncbi:MAG: HD-GYP domain-containing protein [Acidimicrobiia bacterium]|nr:HD-GYP domain-containing protein [Acidimicrobiia bacterium]